MTPDNTAKAWAKRIAIEDALLFAMTEAHPGWWASNKLAQHIGHNRHDTTLGLQRLKRRGMVECEVMLWRARR